MRSDRDRRAQQRDDAATESRLLQQRHARHLKRLLLIGVISMLVIAMIGYALAIWWR